MCKKIFYILLIIFIFFSQYIFAQSNRIRDLGIKIGVLQPETNNAITDGEGVKVGHFTLIRGDSVRNGITAILPHAKNIFQEKVPAAIYIGNGFGN